jgi:hypothetical protein
LELGHHEAMFRIDGSGYGLSTRGVAADYSTLTVFDSKFAWRRALSRLNVIGADDIDRWCGA